MSNTSNTEFMRVQRRLFNIYDNCNFMTNERLEETLDELSFMVRQMVRTRQLETSRPPAVIRPAPRTRQLETTRPPAVIRPVPRTVTPERHSIPIGMPLPMRTAVEIRQAATELRPAAVARTVPSVPMQEVRHTLVAAPTGTWPEHWEHFTFLNKVRAIGRVKFNAVCKEVCGICLNTPTMCDSVTTVCGHQYCKQCWYSWMSNATSNRTCPTCRKNLPKTTTFKLMADRKSRQSVPV